MIKSYNFKLTFIFIIALYIIGINKVAFASSSTPHNYRGTWYSYGKESHDAQDRKYTILKIYSKRVTVSYYLNKNNLEVFKYDPNNKYIEKNKYGKTTSFFNFASVLATKKKIIFRKGKYRTALIVDDGGFNCTLYYRYKLKDNYIGSADGKYGKYAL